MSAVNRISQNFSTRSFAIGITGVAILCGALAGWALLKGEAAFSSRLETMPHRTAEILWASNLAPVAPIKPPNHIAIDVPTPHGNIPPETITAASEPAQPALVTPAPAEPLAEPTPPEKVAETISAEKPSPALTATPLEGLFEKTPWGTLPLIRQADQMTPFKAYRRPFDRAAAGKKNIISVAVYDLGLSDSATKEAMRLPPEISLILSPYMSTPEVWVNEARGRGHEIWLSLPLESKDYPLVDSGPQTALIGAPEKENLDKLYWTMGRAPVYAGFVTSPDSTFLKSEQDMRPFLTRIYGRGLGFIDGSLMPPLIPQTMARSTNAAYGTIDVWADYPADEASIKDAFAQAEKLAAQQGFAAIIIRPFPLSYKLLDAWLETLPQKNIVLAPLSAQTGY